MQPIPTCDSTSTLAIPGGANQIAAMPDHLRIAEDDLTGAQIVALLELHLAEMHQWSPPDSVHSMPVARLRQPDVTFYAAWAETRDGARLAGCGALKQLAADHGELKSMRAHPDYRGCGVGKAILDHLLAEARTRGYRRVSLETGRPQPFAPARGLYQRNGFTECPPFGDYVSDDFSICMTLKL
jgi:putative acetyltransferase